MWTLQSLFYQRSILVNLVRYTIAGSIPNKQRKDITLLLLLLDKK